MSGNRDRGRGRLAAVRGLAAAYELWMHVPIWLTVRHVSGAVSPSGIWPELALGASLVGAGLSAVIRKLWQQILAALLLAAAAWELWGIAANSPFPPSPGALAAMLFGSLQGMTVVYRQWRTGWYWTGVAVYFAASLLGPLFPHGTGSPALLTLGGVFCLAVALFSVNRRHLRRVTLSEDGGYGVPAELKRHNRWFVAAVLAAMLLLAGGVGGWLIHAVKSGIAAILRALLSLLPEGKELPEPLPEPSSPESFPPLPPAREPGWFMQLLDRLLPYVGLGICALLLAWGAYRLYRHGGAIWRRWRGWIAAWLGRSWKDDAAQGYVDEQTSLFSWEESFRKLRRSRVGRLFRRSDEPGWEALPDSRSRVRYLYRRWLRELSRGGYAVPAHLTPREIASDLPSRDPRAETRRRADNARETADPSLLLDAYYEARYAERDPAEEDVAALAGAAFARRNRQS
ncbi:DUF4129 domain-containing protein [Cohnella caldifontis]|uniref:DUF4129 domain-containing protein n=1 Tax=Cohnella caldifontis TaxID=3027471 RepID=UPI0023EB2AB6|nr:DUF4129 domain-containing protein [Cohnella sp. YIM B05605]